MARPERPFQARACVCRAAWRAGGARPRLLARLALGLLAGWAAYAGAGEAANPAPEEDAEARARALVEKMKTSDMAGKAACEAMIEMGRAALPAAIEGTRSDTPRVRYWCIAVLSGIGDARGLDPVRKLLGDPDPLVRAVAVWHIQRWWDEPGIPDLVLSRINDPVPEVAGWALRVIQEKKYAKALASLKRLFEKTPNEKLRYDLLTTFAVLQGRDVLPLLKKTAVEDKSAIVRQGAMSCVTLIRPETPQVAEVLLIGLRDTDEAVRETAAKLLRKGFGQYFGYNHRRPPITQMKAVRAWEDWYRKNADRLVWSAEESRFVVPGEPADGKAAPAESAEKEKAR